MRLCPWPWPRAFLSLASRVSVRGKAVLGLGLEPCFLDSTSASNPLIKSMREAKTRVIVKRFPNRESEVESRTKGSRPRPRTQKKSEAKARDSLSEDRPSRGQGQVPRTQPQVFSKKKGLQTSFSGNLQFVGVATIFDWGGLNHKSHAMTSSKICLLAPNQDFAKGEGLN